MVQKNSHKMLSKLMVNWFMKIVPNSLAVHCSRFQSSGAKNCSIDRHASSLYTRHFTWIQLSKSIPNQGEFHSIVNQIYPVKRGSYKNIQL